MIIDGHAHAAGEYSTAASIIATSKKYGLDKIVLCTSPKNNLGLKAPPNFPFMKSPSSIYFLNRMLRLAYKSFKDYGDGKLPVADTSGDRLSTAICNDLHFPPLIRQAGANNADILIAPYNDVIPFGSSDAITAIFRAIENGFSLLRPAGHGTSMIVDYEGRILASQNYFTNDNGIMLTTIPIHGATTIYSRIGDLFAYVCVAGLILLTGWAFIHRDQPVLIVQTQHS
jgi:apolipoprotein N-acyltransferase